MTNLAAFCWQESPSALLSSFLEQINRHSTFTLQTELSSAAVLLAIRASVQRNCRSIFILPNTTALYRYSALAQALAFSACDVLLFPSWDVLPDELLLPSGDIVGHRLKTLYLLASSSKPTLVLTTWKALSHCVPLPETSRTEHCIFQKGNEQSWDDCLTLLELWGYEKTAVTREKGEFSIRGGIIDIFPLSSPHPFRLEWFGDEIESIRCFNPHTQISTEQVASFSLLPADEKGLLSSEETSFFDYLTKRDLLFFNESEQIPSTIEELAALGYFSSPHTLSQAQLFEPLRAHPHRIALSPFPLEKEISTLLKISSHCFKAPFEPLSSLFPPAFFASTDSREKIAFDALSSLEDPITVLLFSPHEDELEEWKKKVAQWSLPHRYEFIQGAVFQGIYSPEEKLAVLSLSEKEGATALARPHQRTFSSPDREVADVCNLAAGDYVVHVQYGIGQYLRTTFEKDIHGSEREFFVIEYSNQAKLYVPLTQSYLVSRYIGSKEEKPTLSSLTSQRWQQVKAQTQQSIYDYASDLLEIEAKRHVGEGSAYPSDSPLIAAFAHSFPYEETVDQKKAIEAINKDFCSTKMMDRLLCGNVGFGKSEVAMRAAWKTIIDGKKQVLMFAPTTVLAMQHYDSFVERMTPCHPVNIAMLSRFLSPSKRRTLIDQINRAEVDLVIGTHALLSPELTLDHVGLLIIDEEQRLGVRAKEYLKERKREIDCLSLSATPIPRTLYLSLMGAKELSLLQTAPGDRIPVRTIVMQEDPKVIQQAILRELYRKGQVFYLDNSVANIPWRVRQLSKLVPQARITAMHGQMDPADIDAIFHQFRQGEVDILVATTIIENGIDVPNANTIFVHRADTFGLADLHQLRGRVGRWNRSAFAYFLLPSEKAVSTIAQKRLDALLDKRGQQGIHIALRDLEIRGAGTLLGTKQSGHASKIGFSLYCQLLKQAIASLKGEKSTLCLETKVDSPFPAYFPIDYIEQAALRMDLYQRLGNTTTLEAIATIFDEIKDRFGPWPEEVDWLYHATRIRLFAARHGFVSLEIKSRVVVVTRCHQGKTESFRLPFTTPPSGKVWESQMVELLSLECS